MLKRSLYCSILVVKYASKNVL